MYKILYMLCYIIQYIFVYIQHIYISHKRHLLTYKQNTNKNLPKLFNKTNIKIAITITITSITQKLVLNNSTKIF